MKNNFLILTAVVIILIGIFILGQKGNTSTNAVTAPVEEQQFDEQNSFTGQGAQAAPNSEAPASSAGIGSAGANASESVIPPDESEMFNNTTGPPNGTVPPPTFDTGFTPVK